MPEWWGKKAIKNEIAKYFPRCPFCLENTVTGHRDNWNAVDTAICSSCGAKWHLYHSVLTEKMQWAELKNAGSEGEVTLLGIKHTPEFWRTMFLVNQEKSGKSMKGREATVTAESAKQNEVTVNFRRCPYCRTVYDESLSTCPECGALAVKHLLKLCTDKLENIKKQIHE